MKAATGCFLLVAFSAAFAQGVALYTADYYRVNPESYLNKEVTLAVAYVMPDERAREDGMKGFKANTYNQNRWGGHITITAPPDVASRLAQQCGAKHVYDHSRITFIHGILQKDKDSSYYVFVPK